MKAKIKRLVKKILGRGRISYHLDMVSANQISGWALNDVAPSSPCNVEVREGEKVLASTRAATLREDLLEAGIGNGCHGFTLDLEMVPFSAQAREVHLYVDGKRITSAPIKLQSAFTEVLGDFASEVEKRMDALLAIQNERFQREFNYLKSQLDK
ncbi:hypothetical protein [Alteromonas macleodii]|uniref:hypothetical protein n=1 Tax=Alteromonas macleodii TaxID=28108 RepID=UPI00193098C2|nr:hypothetical protein [Alteromonas macleodii]|tara:strand:- start:12791 stop:13255 length:465 start_codon:yes stop_codon:yes gene_type:complete